MDVTDDADCWLVRAGRKGGEHVDAFVAGGRISLGFASMGPVDLREISDEEIEARLVDTGRERAKEDRKELRQLQHMQLGDVVVTYDGTRRDVILGVVSGEYEFSEEPVVGDHRHHRSVEWLARWPRDALPGGLVADLNWGRTVRHLADEEGWRQLARRCADGEGRPPEDPSPQTRRSHRLGADDVVRTTTTERRCPDCHMTRAASAFDGDVCRDCA